MANIGDNRNRYGRAYRFVNPNATMGPPVWVLSTRDITESQPDDDELLQSGSATLDAFAGSISRAVPLVFTSLGTVTPAKADDIATSGLIGVSINAANPGQTVRFTTDGDISFTNIDNITEEGNSTLQVGSLYYLSSLNAGKITLTPDTTTAGSAVVSVGRAIDVDRLAIEISLPTVI
tara:strand:+ start:1014 stop:1547 length:534 start_codon:yes stop_codon:yes gene_type:complete